MNLEVEGIPRGKDDGFLVLTISPDEGVEIGGIKIYLRRISGKDVRIACVGPRDIPISRFKWKPDAT